MASLYPHPWDPLSGEEITRAIDVVKKSHGEKFHWQAVSLLEPRKTDMTSWLEKKGPRPQRLADVTAIGANGKVYDAFVDLASGIIIKWEELKDCQPIVSLRFIISLYSKPSITDQYHRSPSRSSWPSRPSAGPTRKSSSSAS